MPAGRWFEGDHRRHVAMPLGGIGTGSLGLGGTGALKQWQLHNQGNHLGFLPQSFFALRASCVEPPRAYRRILRSAAPAPDPEPAPLVNDHLDAAGQYARPFAWPDVAGTRFQGGYPFARVQYVDEWPLEVQLEAYNPLVLLDAEASGLPLASFTFSVRNLFSDELAGWLFGALQNAVGWDGVTPIRDERCALLGGNVNGQATIDGGTVVLMTNPSLAADHPGAGSMAIWTSAPALGLSQFDDADAALVFLDTLRLLDPDTLDDWRQDPGRRSSAALRAPMRVPGGPSSAGRTWSGGVALPFCLAPGETAELEIVFAWHFPNRRADFEQFGVVPDPGTPSPWIGNHYATAFADAESVVRHFAEHRDSLRESSLRWRDAIFGSSLPEVMVDALAAQPSLIRSPTTFRTADGRFFGHEGVLGESTLNWNGNVGGSCPLNCTHVWNYEQAVSRIFPSLERSMRETDWEILQAHEGYLPHRVLLPIDGPQLPTRPLGGPVRPAIDGMLGTVLKTYREARQGAGEEWLARFLPNMSRLMDYVTRTWDPEGSGVLTGDQPVTHDISLQGANMYVGGLWLAALRTMQAVLGVLGRDADSAGYRQRFEASSSAYDRLLWNGEYYAQQSDGEAYDFGAGCLSDQLFGQWWAHQLDLGHLLPEEHVRSALTAIVGHNFRRSFRGFEHGYRVFADAGDAGLVNCSWPRGGRPSVPIRYADEVWTGVEYQVAAHCLQEGLHAQGQLILAAVRARYDGRRRNPYNEIECGDHYSRAMSGWSLLEAATRSGYDALTGHLRLGVEVDRYPLLAATGWGEVRAGASSIELRCLGGTIVIRALSLPDLGVLQRSITDFETAVHPIAARRESDGCLVLADGQTLVLVRPVG